MPFQKNIEIIISILVMIKIKINLIQKKLLNHLIDSVTN